MSMGHSWYSAFLLLLTTLPFFLSTWEEYHTGVLYLGYVNGPTEGLILACVVMLISGFMGPLFWRSNAVELFGTGFGVIPDDWILLDLMVAGMTILMVVGHIPPW
jgi:ethanolaminephosphotransferase